jgi:EAL domain-containing protein (putative c-di-GMP-specific phosphodiesterase class I)
MAWRRLFGRGGTRSSHSESGGGTTGGVDAVIRMRRFQIVFQPVIDLRDFSITGVEALARFPQTENPLPEYWFDRARERGATAELEMLTASSAVRGAQPLPPEIYLAINLSAATASDDRLPALIDLAGRQIVIEITEHEIVEDYPRLELAIGGLRRLGSRVAVDDTGAGWASLRHVLELRPEIIKLDGTLTARVTDDVQTRALTAALVRFAVDVGSTIVAECVEDLEQAAVLRDLGVTNGQGFGLCPPVAVEQILQLELGSPVR